MIMPNLKIRELRDAVFHTAPCCYKHLKRIAQGWTPKVKQLKDKLREFEFNAHSAKLPRKIPETNCCLINRYRDGQDSMGFHSDGEVALGKNPFLLLVSLGEECIFSFKHIVSGEIKSVSLPHGTVVLMYGHHLQRNWQHGLRKTKDQKRQAMRINLSFRHHISKEAWSRVKGRI